jgi:hypothetical protein
MVTKFLIHLRNSKILLMQRELSINIENKAFKEVGDLIMKEVMSGEVFKIEGVEVEDHLEMIEIKMLKKEESFLKMMIISKRDMKEVDLEEDHSGHI